mmetsp:Transcript_12564/g.38381  ORF Transcript_12564/g.38381 Transcript_12564/m.38381 type:complete len:90 (+) Transcript_12564:128-397(+)
MALETTERGAPIAEEESEKDGETRLARWRNKIGTRSKVALSSRAAPGGHDQDGVCGTSGSKDKAAAAETRYNCRKISALGVAVGESGTP